MPLEALATSFLVSNSTSEVASRRTPLGWGPIDPIFLGTYEQFLKNPAGIPDPEDSEGEFLALSGALVWPATWHGLSSERPVRPPDTARVCPIMMIGSDGEGVGGDIGLR